jgi:hypothetical protein
MHLELNSEASSTLRVKQYNQFKSAMKNILLGSAWLVHIPMGLWVSTIPITHLTSPLRHRGRLIALNLQA